MSFNTKQLAYTEQFLVVNYSQKNVPDILFRWVLQLYYIIWIYHTTGC